MRRKALSLGKLYFVQQHPYDQGIYKLVGLEGTPPGYGLGSWPREAKSAKGKVRMGLVRFPDKAMRSTLLGPPAEAVVQTDWKEGPIIHEVRLACVKYEWTDQCWADEQTRRAEMLAFQEQHKADCEACEELQPALDALLKRLGIPGYTQNGGASLEIHAALNVTDIRELLAKHATPNQGR